MSTGQITKFQKTKGFESLPREMLQDTNLSLEAIGLLSYMQSLPEDWKLYKTELYTRFPKNKRRSIDNIWKELVEHNYLLNFKKREGKKYVYSYVFTVVPFSKEEAEQITKEHEVNGFWDVRNEQSTVNSSKRATSKLNNKKVLHKNDGIDTSLDTDKSQAPNLDLAKLSEEIESEIKNPKSQSIPADSLQTLKNFEICFNQSTYELIGSILRAKKEVGKEEGRLLSFEQFEEDFNQQTKIICNAIYKKSKANKLRKTPEDYLYVSFVQYFKEQAFKLEQLDEMENYPIIPGIN